MADQLDPRVWAPARNLPDWWEPPDWEEEARIRKQQELEQQRRQAAADATDDRA